MLPIAAAIPPSAITVCALPRSDLQIRPTLTPFAAASMAARKPAPPAPMTRTSYECCSIGMLQEPDVVPDAHRAQADIHVGECNGEQADERPVHVPAIEAARAVVGELAGLTPRQLVEITAGDVPHRMATERVAGKEHDIGGEDH